MIFKIKSFSFYLSLILFMTILNSKTFSQEMIELKIPNSDKIIVRLMFSNGSKSDPAGKEGLTYTTASLITQGGTGELTYSDIQDKIYPMAAAHPAVAECGVVGVPDPDRGQIVKAFVVVRDGAPDDAGALARELQDFVKQEIAPYKYPRAVAFLEALPRTQTGKLQRFKLRELEPTNVRDAGLPR